MRRRSAGARRQLGRWGAQEAGALGRQARGRAGVSGRGRTRRRQACAEPRWADDNARGRCWRGAGVGADVGARGAQGGRAAWACLCAQARRAGWSVGPSWCTVHCKIIFF